MCDKLLKELNPAQREAVCHKNGPLLVLAGAGSGKTRVITYRIAHLVAGKTTRADRILGVTFTNKAAGEMKERVIELLGQVGRFVRLSTFHSFGARLLRSHIEMIGYNRDFTIYDNADSGALIKRIINDLGFPKNQPAPLQALSKISRAKDKLISPEVFTEAADDFITNNISRIYHQYQAQLKKNNAVDFDDLLFLPVQLLEKFPDILASYRNRFPYLLVDEYQDTNYVQYRLLKLLTGESKNICVVGDDDQSIYGWRGADIRNILDFESDFSGCKVIKLEQNYRSTSVILDSAYEVIRKNKKRKAKKLFTEKQGGEMITLVQCGDERDEAEAIVTKIRMGLSDNKCPSDYAVLFRTHAQSRSLEDAMRDRGIPYIIVGGTEFYKRKEIKDVVAYLRLLVNPSDGESLLRIINVPGRKAGKVTVKKLLKEAENRNVSLFEALSNPETAGVAGKTASELKKLHNIFNGISPKINELSPREIATRLVDKVGYLKMLEDEATPEADVRADNVKELIIAIDTYIYRTEEEQEENQEPSLAGFLEEVALISEVDNLDENESAVTLMTLHAAKGLEFDTVFLTGMEDGLFPLIRDMQSDDEIEEERRLCYVGITRAKSKLNLSMAGFRRRYDGPNFSLPSCFLDDIPKDLLEVERYNYYDDRLVLTGGNNADKTHWKKSKKKVYSDNSKYNTYDDEDNGTLQEGMIVSHSKFGIGRVIDKEGSGDDMIIIVRFKTGTKKLMYRYAALEILGI